jgi:hypothetical protein
MEQEDPREAESPARASSPLRALGHAVTRGAWSLVLTLGWLALLCLLGALVLEKSGWIQRRIERSLEHELAALERPVALRSVELRWPDREVVLHGFELGDGGEDVAVERVALRLGWREPQGLVVVRAEIADGRVHLTRELLESIRKLSSGEKHETGDMGSLGRLILRNVDVVLGVPAGHDIPVGRLDALVEPNDNGEARIRGRLLTAASRPTGTAGELSMEGGISAERELRLRATGRSLPLDTWLVAAGEELGGLSGLEPRGGLDVDAEASYTLGKSLLPKIELRMRIDEGSVRLPHVAPGEERLEHLSLDLAAHFDPRSESAPSMLDRRLWQARARASASWRDTHVHAGLELPARPSLAGVLETWVDVPEVNLDDATLEVLGRPKLLVEELFPWLEPRGRAAVHAGLRLDPSFTGESPLEDALEAAVLFRPLEKTSAAYHGPELDGRSLGEGFPLRLEGIDGAVLFAWTPSVQYSDELGLFAIQGNHGSGRARVDGSWHRLPLSHQPAGDTGVRSDFWLHAESATLRIDPVLGEAFQGLEGVLPPEELWERFHPAGGNLSFTVDLWLNHSAPGLAAKVDVVLRDAGASLQQFPLPLTGIDGTVHVTVDGRKTGGGGFAAQLDLLAHTSASDRPLALRGRVEREMKGRGEAPLEDLELHAQAVDLTSSELQTALEDSAGELVDFARSTKLAGHVDLDWRRVRAWVRAGSVSRLEAVPAEGAELELPGLELFARDLSGRVVARFEEDPPVEGKRLASSELWVAPLTGVMETSREPLPLALRARLLPSGAFEAEVFVSGLDPSDAELVARVQRAFALESGSDAGFDAGDYVSGRLDVYADLNRPPTGRMGGKIHLHPRRLALGPPKEPVLANLDGELVLDENGLRAELLRGTLADTPVELRALALLPSDDGFDVSTRVSAVGLPLDHAHLSRFVHSDALRQWIDDLRWRGKMDVDRGLLTARLGAGGISSIAFHGDLALSDLFLQLGVPVQVRSAAARGVELVYEEGALRAWGRIEGLYAQMDGRRLDDARMLVTFVQPRLTVENFQGRFEEGDLSSLGAGTGGGGEFFALDLVPPYPFGLSIEVREVDIGGLLRGLFQSDFANQGKLRGMLRLNGDTAHLLDLRGQGFVELRDSSLWSIPVFQALFSQLGFDSTATFDEMRSSFSIESGAIHMRNMRAESPLLHLVGKGTLGLDGSLSHELEVRYSLVDRLGPITVLLYKIQKSLLRVSVRGDMERPKVELRGLLPSFFPSERETRALPLPSFSELPRRF